MVNNIYNHKTLIKGLQPAGVKSLYPGMIVQFKYKGQNINDKLPLVLVLWNDYQGYAVHGINLNYLKNAVLKQVMTKLTKGKSKKPDVVENPVTEKDQDDSKYDDNLPSRNLLKKPYTQVEIPTFREKRDGKIMNKAQAKKELKLLYEKTLKKYVDENQMYRTYSYKKMTAIKVTRLDLERFSKI